MKYAPPSHRDMHTLTSALNDPLMFAACLIELMKFDDMETWGAELLPLLKEGNPTEPLQMAKVLRTWAKCKVKRPEQSK